MRKGGEWVSRRSWARDSAIAYERAMCIAPILASGWVCNLHTSSIYSDSYTPAYLLTHNILYACLRAYYTHVPNACMHKHIHNYTTTHTHTHIIFNFCFLRTNRQGTWKKCFLSTVRARVLFLCCTPMCDAGPRADHPVLRAFRTLYSPVRLISGTTHPYPFIHCGSDSLKKPWRVMPVSITRLLCFGSWSCHSFNYIAIPIPHPQGLPRDR